MLFITDYYFIIKYIILIFLYFSGHPRPGHDRSYPFTGTEISGKICGYETYDNFGPQLCYGIISRKNLNYD